MRYLILVTNGEKFEVKGHELASGIGDTIEILSEENDSLACFPINNVVYIISMDHVTTVSE